MEKSYLDGAFEIKEEDVEESGIFKGYGSTFGGKGDSYNHVVVPGAFAETLKKNGHNGMGVACLWQHDSREPIGTWLELMEDKKGLKVTGQLIREVPAGDKAYHLLKKNAIRGLSIGYDTIIFEDDAKKKLRYLKEIDLWEISLVTFPANPRAGVTVVKELLQELEQAKDIRELESFLRDSKDFSKNEAQRIISIIKASLRDSETVGKEGLSLILDGLKDANKELEVGQTKEDISDILNSLITINK